MTLLKDIFSKTLQKKPQISQRKKKFLNYKLDCLLLKRKPMSYNEFKKKYADKKYIEEDLF